MIYSRIRVQFRTILAAILAACIGLGLSFPSFAAEKDVLRIGYQKSSSLLIILKANGALERALAPLNVEVKWSEFSSGLPLLEGVNVGSIDISADVAEPVPLFAQAAGAKLTYLAQEAPSPKAQAIVVPADSPIRTVADLKGKKVGFTKAAGVHFLLLNSLKRAGLKFRDIEPAYLQPADARAAFERGAIDAWATWDPHLANLQSKRAVRVIADGTYADVGYRRYYLASSEYARRRPDVLKVVFNELRKTGRWVKQNKKQAAKFHAPLIGLAPATVEIVNARRSYDIRPVDERALRQQQSIADAFAEARLLPRRINPHDNGIWNPKR